MNVVIHIMANVPFPNTLVGYDNIEGSHLSSESEIKVNKTSDGYSVIFTDDRIAASNPDKLSKTLLKLFLDNLPTSVLNVYMIYYCKTENGNLVINYDAAYKIIELSFELCKIQTNCPQFNYCVTNNMRALVSEFNKMADVTSDEQDNNDIEEDIEEEDDDDDRYSAFDILDEAMRGYDRKYRKKKRSKKHYNMSRVLRAAKNPKKMYNRHGIVVCKDKKAIDKDKRAIKEFLSDFIPGRSSWKKEFRRELCKRWMQMYVLTPKQLKIFQKDFKKKHRKPRSGINTEKTLELTRKLFGVTTDIWSDPTR